MSNKINNEDVFKTIFETSVEGILVVTKDGSIQMANVACEQIFGYDSGELLDKNIDILIPDNFRKQHKTHVKTYSKNPKPRNLINNIDLWGIKKDGTEFCLDISLSPTKIKDEQLTIAFLRDATIRKNEYEKIQQTNAALIESNRKFDALINNLQGIVYRCKNDKDWTIEYISEGCQDITGYGPKSFLNGTTHFSHITLQEDLTEVWNSKLRKLDKKKPFILSYRITDKKGRIKYLHELGRGIFDKNGNLEAIEGFITDVTAQKEQELALKENQARTKALLEAIPDMIFIQNRKGEYLDWYCNTPEKLFMPPKKFIGLHMEKVLPPHVYNSFKTAHQKLKESGEMQLAEYCAKGKKDMNHYEARMVLMNDHKILTIVRDVTENKNLERDIGIAEIRSNAILNALPDLFFVHDENVNLLEIHASNPSLLNAPVEDLIGKNIKEVLPSDIAKQISNKLAKVRKTKHMEMLQMTVNSMKGLVDLDVRFVPLADNKTLSIARDVTDLNAKTKLLQIRSRALEAADNSILIVDAQNPNLPITYCNDAFEKVTGYTKKEVYGRNCNFLQNDDRDQKEIAIMRNAIKHGETCHVVLRNYKKDGTLFWNELTITPVKNEAQQLTHFIGVQNDVSNRIKQEKLKDQIRRILELITKDRPITQICNNIIETVETHLEDGMASVLLLDKKSKTLHKLAALHIPKDFSDFIEGISIGPKVGSCGTAAFLKKEIIVADIKNNSLWKNYKDIALKNGLRSCWAYPIMSSTNQVLGTFAIYNKHPREPLKKEKEIILDMTYLASIAIEKHYNTISLKDSKTQLEQYAHKLEEKVQQRTKEVMATVKQLVESNLDLEDQILITEQAEKNALLSKALVSEVAKNFPRGFITVVDKNFQIVLAEGEALAEVGLKPFIFEGISIDDIFVFSEERKVRIKGDIVKTLSGKHLSFETKYKNRYFSVNTAPLLDENLDRSNALLVYSDISQQKEIEFNIQKALKKEKELNELKSRFISMASHEFRTPLSAILTSAILIAKQNEPGQELKREKYVVQIEKNVKHLVTILNDFLSLSKLEEGKIAAIKEHIDLINLAKVFVEESKVSLKKGQHIILSTPRDELFLNLDAKLFRHIITNLLSNASKYSPENSNIDFKILQHQNHILIQITDQGIGIPEEEQKHLFERFFRANNAINIEGTGLGLNIVKHYTELLGGIIGFKSRLNIGTTFWVELPIMN
ncbi:hypothetical protein GCM10023314_19530 [Algibacter agarivorans]|uniref:histidine kinase n=1 Tax=Algibacter agarivorans TaxID=1109741 RepID=A0ABP9GK91_9FLAO